MADSYETYVSPYTDGEEIANSVTHAIGFGLSIAGLINLIVCARNYGDTWHIVTFSIFGATLILLYMASMLYHSIPTAAMKRRLKLADHCAIFLLIAGTYTPFMLTSLRGTWGWSLFITIWVLAIAGIFLKIFFYDRYDKVSLAIYLLMGWLAVVALNEILARIEFQSIVLLFAGGLFYTFGAAFYSWRSLPYNHAIWHLFVMGGSICHYFSVLYIVL